MIRDFPPGSYLGDNPWRELKCSNCGQAFEAWRNEEDNCPKCNSKFTWIPKLKFYEVKCIGCGKFTNIELDIDGSCEFCGQEYKWKKTIPTIFNPEPRNYLLWK